MRKKKRKGRHTFVTFLISDCRLFGNHEEHNRARYYKRESGASDMTTVTYIGCSSSSSGRCHSLSGSTNAAVTASIKSNILNAPTMNCV